jgi:hypothetical protein
LGIVKLILFAIAALFFFLVMIQEAVFDWDALRQTGAGLFFLTVGLLLPADVTISRR